MKRLLAGLVAAVLLSSCGPSGRETSLSAAEACLDAWCQGDVAPPFDPATQEVLKLNGKWFVGPKKYFTRGHNGAIFYWPSKTPMAGSAPGVPIPEGAQPFSEIAIEILLRSYSIPPEPRGHRLIGLAQKNGWIKSRLVLRKGLERIEMKHVKGPAGYFIDHITYYVATDLVGPDGLPPVGGCNHSLPDGGGGGGFMWQEGVWAGIRMNQKHCADWPEIYQEVSRVLGLLRKA
jgi:hypothetical protein